MQRCAFVSSRGACGDKTEFSTTSPKASHSASRAFGKSIDAISLSFHKEMAKEKEPRGLIPLGTPQDFSLSASAARGGKTRSTVLKISM